MQKQRAGPKTTNRSGVHGAQAVLDEQISEPRRPGVCTPIVHHRIPKRWQHPGRFSRPMANALADMPLLRAAYGKLTISEILKPCWVAAIRIRKHNPWKGQRIVNALMAIPLVQDEKKPLATKQAACARGGADLVTTSTSLPVVRLLVNALER